MAEIRIITEPRVYVVGCSAVLHSELDRFLADEGVPQWTTDTLSGGEILIENGGRLCYQSHSKPRPGGNRAYVEHLLECRHGSCLEHATYTLILTGISRRCCEQITRHRVGWSPSQLSQRFVDEVAGGPLEVVLPPGYLTHYEVYLCWGDAGRDPEYTGLTPGDWESIALISDWISVVEHAADVYEEHAETLFRSAHIPDKTLRRKRAREAARSVLPNCAETKIQVTCNARSLRHWIELRGSEAADLEINRVACKVFEAVRALTPNLFADYAVTPNPDGTRSIVTGNRKV